MRLFRLTLTAALLAALAGCGQPKKAAPKVAADSASCCGSAAAAAGTGCNMTFTPESAAATPPSGGLNMAAELAIHKPKMWDFGSDKCVACKTMLGILDPLGDEYKEEVAILFVNVYEYKDWAQKCNIVTIPTQVFIDASGKEVFRHIGVYPRDSIIARFQALGFSKRAGSAAPAPAAGATGGT